MPAPRDVRAILALWPSIEEMSRDVDVPYQTVHSWGRRNSIPARYWDGIVAAAKKRGFRGVTIDLLRMQYARAAQLRQRGE